MGRGKKKKKIGREQLEKEEHLSFRLTPVLNLRSLQEALATDADGTIQQRCLKTQDLSRAVLGPQGGWHTVSRSLFPHLCLTLNMPRKLCQPKIRNFGDSAHAMDFGVWLLWNSPSFCEQWMQKKHGRKGTQKLSYGATTSDRFADTCEAPFWGLPESTGGHFEGLANLFLLEILQ